MSFMRLLIISVLLVAGSALAKPNDGSEEVTDAPTQHTIGLLFLAGPDGSGKGFQKDDKVAMSWFLRAANQGYADSQWMVGDLYRTGFAGTPADARKAVSEKQPTKDMPPLNAV